ncbi:hypothetical protein CDS [Bradyrhizobium sp.]|nr:hypothetical protein CDS [Bradyrhizobium sp.]
MGTFRSFVAFPIFRRFKIVATPAIVIPGCAEGASYDAQLRI